MPEPVQLKGTMFHGGRMTCVRGGVRHYQKRGRIGLGGKRLRVLQSESLKKLAQI